MAEISNRTNNENNDTAELPPPPPYTTVIYKTDDYDFDGNPPPNYADVGQSVVYINNYPGPPLTDGQVQTSLDNVSTNHESIISKKVCIYLLVNGCITILLGLAAVGLEIGIVVSNSIIYYYFGFWGGALVIGIGISTVLYHRYRINHIKMFQSFFWQMIVIAVIFGIGIVIILTDKCDDISTDSTGDRQCRESYKILNGFLLGTFAMALLQSIVNVIVFGIMKKRHPRVSISLS